MSTIEQTQPMSEIVQDYRKRLMVFGGQASGELASHIAATSRWSSAKSP